MADDFANAMAAARALPEYNDLAMFGLADATPEQQEVMIAAACAAAGRLARRSDMRDERGEVVRCSGPGCTNAAVGFVAGAPACEACMPPQVGADPQGRVPSPSRPYEPEEDN